MNKVFVSLLLVLSGTIAHAYEIGDWFVDQATGIPSVIVYLDETGEHGLIMAPCGGYYSDKDIQKDIKYLQKKHKKYHDKEIKTVKDNGIKRGADVSRMEDHIAQADELFNAVIAYLPSMPLMAKTKLTEAKEHEMLSNIAAGITGNGVQDQQLIIDYCTKNNVDMSYYFHSIEWVQKLGEGWFIPGNHELELFASSVSYGLGVPMTKEETTQTGFMYYCKTWMLNTVFPSGNICSSTCLQSPWEAFGDNKSKTGVIYNAQDMNFEDNYYVLGTSKDFVGKWFYALIKNRQMYSYDAVAFKYF